MAKSIPMTWEEPKPERNHGRGFANEDVKRGYSSEPMYDHPSDKGGRQASRRKWFREDEETYDNGYDY